MYRIQQVKMNPDEPISLLPAKIIRKLRKSDIELRDMKIVKRSIDARGSEVKFVYTVDFNVIWRKSGRPAQLRTDKKIHLSVVQEKEEKTVIPGSEPMNTRPVVAGFGPCGMFAALTLAEAGYSPIVIERGMAVEDRVKDVENFWKTGNLNPESNVQFGEGGAGTFSDGKLTTGITNKKITKVLTDFVEAGASEDIMYLQKPHIGTDVLRTVVKNIREKIISLGGEIRFANKLETIHQKDGVLTGITVKDNLTGEKYDLETENLIVSVGHSARDTFEMLYNSGVEMKQKPFSIGVRIEHPQQMIDLAQYGNSVLPESPMREYLPPADYKLSYHCENGRGVYTFCMCPGGEVIMAASEPETAVTNGMSNSRRDSGIANSGLLVDVRTSDFGSDHPLAGVEFQRKFEHKAFLNGGYRGPRACWADFRDGTEKAKPLIDSLPDFAVESICEAMPHLGRKLKGFDSDDANMIGVETRSSSPVRFSRNDRGHSTISGIYPAGEGAGYAGGIMSAACDGIKAAERIIEYYKPPQI